MREFLFSCCLLILAPFIATAEAGFDLNGRFAGELQAAVIHPPPMDVLIGSTFVLAEIETTFVLGEAEEHDNALFFSQKAMFPTENGDTQKTKTHINPLAQNFNFAFTLKGGLAATIA